MIRLDGFWDFVAYRPGLSAMAHEWKNTLGEDGWLALRGWIFVGDGIAPTCTCNGRPVKVVPMSKGAYSLVCPTTGNVEQTGLAEADVKAYRLDVGAFRSWVAEGLGITADPQPIRDAPGAFPVGSWSPVAGVDIPMFMILPPRESLLASEIGRLLLEVDKRFILFVPKASRLSSSLRERIESQQAAVVPLAEILECDDAGRCSATASWQTYQNSYCQQHLADQMVPALPDYQFAKRGMWALRFAGKETYLEGDLKGAAFIHYLIQHQGQEIHVIRMMADVAGAERMRVTAAAEGLATDSAVADDAADKQTIKDCQARYDQLVAERQTAKEDRLAEIETEIAEIAAYLSSALGLGKRSRKIGDDVATARRRIARVINITYDKIEGSDPELATHLRNSIRTHIEMAYEPDREVDWVLT